jgi:hypothetical protein
VLHYTAALGVRASPLVDAFLRVALDADPAAPGLLSPARNAEPSLAATVARGGEDRVEITFSEYVHILGSVGLLGRTDMARVAFCAIDEDGTGVLDEGQIEAMIGMLRPTKAVERAVRARLTSLCTKHGDNFVKMREFLAITHELPRLLAPVLQFQAALRKASFGHRWWEGKARDLRAAAEKVRKLDEETLKK